MPRDVNPGEFNLVEASIAEIRAALDQGVVTSVELVAAYLNRIACYDRHGIRLNAVPVLNPDMFKDAAAADARRAAGEVLGPLDGIPYTAKNSYKAKGLTVASGSPAFEHLVANEDAFTIAQLRAAGAVLIGLTNMPPMANGGMERGVYGRAESPYNGDYLTSAFYSGSSNGSGTATAASFAAFGLGEETWSSGRAPASCNALAAYTPSRGVISMRGNWPLVPTMDVVVPHARSMDDLLEILDIIVADDSNPRGDFWRMQKWLDIPASSQHRPKSYKSLADRGALKGKRLGVPRMFINRDASGVEPVETRASVIACWDAARRQLEALGAEVVDIDFPVVSNYERDDLKGSALVARGVVPAEFPHAELWDLCMFAWDDFLAQNGDPKLRALKDVDGPRIFPLPKGALPDRTHQRGVALDLADYVMRAKSHGITPLAEIAHLADGIRGLERARVADLDEWLAVNKLDAVVFPALADVAPADADTNQVSSDISWRNGTWVANGNLVIRHLGIPTVTVPMGMMQDIGMPIGLTFASKAYDDLNLLRYAYAFDAAGAHRQAPPRTPPLPGDTFALPARTGSARPAALSLRAESAQEDNAVVISIAGETDAPQLDLFVSGRAVAMERTGAAFQATLRLSGDVHQVLHSEWRAPYGSVVIALARGPALLPRAQFVIVGGI